MLKFYLQGLQKNNIQKLEFFRHIFVNMSGVILDLNFDHSFYRTELYYNLRLKNWSLGNIRDYSCISESTNL